MQSLGEEIRKQRQARKMPLRSVAEALGIDVAILSKLERGIRLATRDQIVKLADYFSIDSNHLLKIWLAEKILYQLGEEEMSSEALQIAEEEIAYKTKRIPSVLSIKSKLKEVFKSDSRILKAWIFGSFARAQANESSDLDIMIEVDESSTFSLFDLADIQYQGEKSTGFKIDIVVKGAVRSFATESVNKDLVLIYEK